MRLLSKNTVSILRSSKGENNQYLLCSKDDARSQKMVTYFFQIDRAYGVSVEFSKGYFSQFEKLSVVLF